MTISSYLSVQHNVIVRLCDISAYKFDVCVTVHRWNSNTNNQLDATMTVY